MNILLVSATEAEIAIFTDHLSRHWQSDGNNRFKQGSISVTVLVTGVGMVAATYATTRALLQNKFDMAVQAGIGGAFDRRLPLGTVVQVASERYADMGAEDHDHYLDIFDMGLIKGDLYPYDNGLLMATPAAMQPLSVSLPFVSSLSVNMVSGNGRTITRLQERYGCQVESMEGAAFHYACLMERVPFVQVRGISNYVEPRNRAAWNIGAAVRSLNEWLIQFLT